MFQKRNKIFYKFLPSLSQSRNWSIWNLQLFEEFWLFLHFKLKCYLEQHLDNLFFLTLIYQNLYLIVHTIFCRFQTV